MAKGKYLTYKNYIRIGDREPVSQEETENFSELVAGAMIHAMEGLGFRYLEEKKEKKTA